VRSLAAEGRWFLREFSAGAGVGAFVGAAVAGAVGLFAGTAAGWYNEATLVGEQYEELFRGFAEYTAREMGFWCTAICVVYGGIAGAISGAVARVSRRRLAGGAVGAALPLVLWSATGLFHDGRNQAGVVWLAGMMAGSVVAGLLMNRIMAKGLA
jgi:hypothetical protein